MPHLFSSRPILVGLAVVSMFAGSPSKAQSAPQPEAESQVAQLQSELKTARSDLQRAQNLLTELSARIDAIQNRTPQPTSVTEVKVRDSDKAASPYLSPVDVARRPDIASRSAVLSDDLVENDSALAQRVEEQQQTKVESSSKYRVKLSGLILMTTYSNRGAVDVPDLPNVALNSPDVRGSFGASLRQSILGLQVYGPELAGAATSAAVSIDFFGGFPATAFGSTNGLVRLRTAGARLDWRNTSLQIGQEALSFSPLSPTSYATVAQPAFSYAGNLWVWTPQATVEHRFHTSDDSFVTVSGSVLAPLSEDPPEGTGGNVIPGPGEQSRQPAFSSQMSWNSKIFGQSFTIGAGGYTSKLRHDFGRQVRSWAATSFWRLPFGSRWELSGEGYRGQAVGGLGGGIWQSVAFAGDPTVSTTVFRPLDAAGGWAQLKYRPHPKWELNGSLGMDDVFAKNLRFAPVVQTEYGAVLARNRASFGNVIFRPKSNLLFSAEYRKLWTWEQTGAANHADQINLAVGVAF
jgi:hypothetical protein